MSLEKDTIEKAKAKRCPYGVAEFCLTSDCMAWGGLKEHRIEVESVDEVPKGEGIWYGTSISYIGYKEICKRLEND